MIEYIGNLEFDKWTFMMEVLEITQRIAEPEENEIQNYKYNTMWRNFIEDFRG